MDDQETLIENKKTPSLYFSIRFLTACIVFLGVAAQYMQKIDMSIGIVCMINHTAVDNADTFKNLLAEQSSMDDSNDTCLFKPNNGTKHDKDGPFDWSSNIQGSILSSYFYGYLVSQIPSGWLSYKIGGRRVFAFSMFFGSILTALVPVCSRLGYIYLIILRCLTGVIHGAVWPAMSAMFVYWSPPLEKSRIIGMAGAGSWIGNVIALPLGSYLCTDGFDGGWPSIYYVFGIMGAVWFALFMLLTADHPKDHRCISNLEREYLIEKTAVNVESSRPRKTPWLLMMTSKSCWGVFVAHFCTNWANYLFLTELPTFMNDILRFDIKSNGFLSTLPYIATWAISCIAAIIADTLIKNNILSIKNTRKLMNCSGFLIAIIATIGLIFVTCADPYLAVVLLTIGLGFFGLNVGAGYMVNVNEVGGIYSGILFGISNCIGTIPGLIAPSLVGAVTKKKLQSEWQIIFVVSIAFYAVGMIGAFILTDSKKFYSEEDFEESSTTDEENVQIQNDTNAQT